jgi:hypothetical protein
MNRRLTWTIASAAALIFCGCAFLNFWAAVNMGYDARPGGATIIARWGYAMFGSCIVAAVSAIIAIRVRRTGR